jgi:type I restriction enzyme R subunit
MIKPPLVNGWLLGKPDPNAANKQIRTSGTLGSLRHELYDRDTRFSLCQIMPVRLIF